MLYESQTFRLEADDQVLTLWLDFRGRPSHCLTFPALNELSLVLDRIAALPAADVLLIRSSRPAAFLDEFDTAELARLSSPLEFAALARRGQDVTRKLELLATPAIALVEGRCAGAGLELALACAHRVAVDSSPTRFELAEVDRGLIPAWGGTYRLLRLVGPRSALRLMRSGDSLGARAAKQMGLVDRVLSPSRLAVDLLSLVDEVRQHDGLTRRSWFRRVRNFFAPAGVNGPGLLAPPPGSAQFELLAAVAAGQSSEGEALAAERVALSRLSASESTRNLLALHRQESMPVRVFPEPANPVPGVPRRIGIVGAGELAVALTCRLARAGHEVVVQDTDGTDTGRAGRRVAEHFAAWVRRGEVSATDLPRLGQAVRATVGWAGFEDTDLVVEAADEDLGVKRNLFHELERRVRPRVILATAGATVAVESIQAEVTRPSRVAGLHFPNWGDRRPVAEIVGTALTDPGTVAALGSWAREWRFTPVRVADRPGRLVGYVRHTYLSEGVSLVAEGLPADCIDRACRQFGMARGPLEWCDEIGFEVLAERTAQLQLARGDGFARNLLFQRLIAYGCVGRTVGEGFYRYGWWRRPSHLTRMVLWHDLDEDATAPYVFDLQVSLREGVERVVLRTVNAAAAALADEPDSDPAAVDLALGFGMGWAPERGGPLRYADSLGPGAVVDRLAYFAERFGPRFTPCDELVRRAEAGETFYGAPPVESAALTRAWRMAG
jgi:3-hydroxyacyl-CoA dehydrogenase / enoyl-CoA hydratase / 3-hydroxybutyryl-CoA epimerase